MEVTKEFLKAAKEAARVRLTVDRLKQGQHGLIRFERDAGPVWSNQTADFPCLGYISDRDYTEVATYADTYIDEEECWKTIIQSLKLGDSIVIKFDVFRWGGSGGILVDSVRLEVTRPGKTYKAFTYLLGSYPYKQQGWGWCSNYYSREDFDKAVKNLQEMSV